MAVTAKSVLKDVSIDILVDATNKKWTAAQLVRFLNRISRIVAVIRPDAYLSKQTITLAAGARQQLPSGYIRLLGVTHNTDSGKAITMPPDCRNLLDAQLPAWRAATQRDDIEHVMYDVREPLYFDVYPPASSSASIQAQLQKAITDIAEPAANTTWNDVVGNLSITDDLVAPAMVEGVAWLAYSKEAQHAAQEARATAHAQNMAAALGVELKSLMELGAQPVSHT